MLRRTSTMTTPISVGHLSSPSKRLPIPIENDDGTKRRYLDDPSQSSLANLFLKTGSVETQPNQKNQDKSQIHSQQAPLQFGTTQPVRQTTKQPPAQMARNTIHHSNGTIEVKIDGTWSFSFKGTHAALLSTLNLLAMMAHCLSPPNSGYEG